MKRFLVLIAVVAALAIGASAEAGQLQLQWIDNSTNEDGFKVERCTVTVSGSCTQTSTNWSQVAAPPANATTYDDVGLADGTGFCYRLRAYNTGGNSQYSNIACGATPIVVVAPPAPTAKQVIVIIPSESGTK
jgi:hypothetical protein